MNKDAYRIASQYAKGFVQNCNRQTMDIETVIRKAVLFGFDTAVKAVDDKSTRTGG